MPTTKSITDSNKYDFLTLILPKNHEIFNKLPVKPETRWKSLIIFRGFNPQADPKPENLKSWTRTLSLELTQAFVCLGINVNYATVLYFTQYLKQPNH